MPIPLIIWAAAAGVSGWLAWTYRKEISDYFSSEEGIRLLENMNRAIEGAMLPYHKLLDEALAMDPEKRQHFFLETKRRLSPESWSILVGYGKDLARRDPLYMATVGHLLAIDESC